MTDKKYHQTLKVFDVTNRQSLSLLLSPISKLTFFEVWWLYCFLWWLVNRIPTVISDEGNKLESLVRSIDSVFSALRCRERTGTEILAFASSSPDAYAFRCSHISKCTQSHECPKLSERWIENGRCLSEEIQNLWSVIYSAEDRFKNGFARWKSSTKIWNMTGEHFRRNRPAAARWHSCNY